MSKYVYGTNVDACIFAFYNSNYQLINSSHIYPENTTITRILDVAIRVFVNPYTEKLLTDLGLPLDTKKLKISKNISDNDILTDKITVSDTGVSLPLNALYSTKDILIGKAEQEELNIYCVKFSTLKTALYSAVKDRIILDPIKFNPDDEFISCIPNNKAAEMGIGVEKVPTLPSTFCLHNTDIYYEPEIVYDHGVRIFYDDGCIITEKTGETAGDLVIRESRIQPDFYHNYPKNIEPLGRFAENNPEHRIEDTIKRALLDSNVVYKLFQDQKVINKQYQDFPRTLEDKQKQTEKFFLHINRKACQLLDNVNWRINEPSMPVSRKEIVEDWCDMFKYWLSIGLVWEIDWKELLEELDRKTNSIIERNKKCPYQKD